MIESANMQHESSYYVIFQYIKVDEFYNYIALRVYAHLTAYVIFLRISLFENTFVRQSQQLLF